MIGGELPGILDGLSSENSAKKKKTARHGKFNNANSLEKSYNSKYMSVIPWLGVWAVSVSGDAKDRAKRPRFYK